MRQFDVQYILVAFQGVGDSSGGVLDCEHRYPKKEKNTTFRKAMHNHSLSRMHRDGRVVAGKCGNAHSSFDVHQSLTNARHGITCGLQYYLLWEMRRCS